jgi:putative phage-type endonuclease
MSFGDLNILIDKIMDYLNINKKEKIEGIDLYKLKNDIYIKFHTEIQNLKLEKKFDYFLIDEIFSRLYSVNYKLNNIIFDNGLNCFRDFENTYPEVKVPKAYKKLEDQFNKLKALPQPAQRSQEWYDYRFNRITASDTAAAIDMNPYEPVESFILKKCDPNFPFQDNATVFHGRKYEPIATLIYEHIYNIKVVEFGALPSEKYPFLGASPDGICSKYTLDNKFSKRLGRMLEIKCPVTRDIHIKGNIVGEICPYYYYCQVQQQLACCELEYCDFWQCKISEYKTKNDYLNDDCSTCINTETIDNKQYQTVSINNTLKKGLILEFYPKNFKPEFEGDNIEWKSKYIMPSRLDMNINQYNDFILKTFEDYKNLYPEIYENYTFNKIIYWKLEKSHNVSIVRDDNFLLNIIPILKNTWEQILYYRKNQDKLNELKKIVDSRKKYMKFNTNFTIHNKYMIDNKILFLDEKYKNKENETKTKKIKKNINDNDSDYCDFIDNNECDFLDD